MPPLALSDCARAIGATLDGEDVELVGVGIDTRTLAPGALYVAIRGERTGVDADAGDGDVVAAELGAERRDAVGERQAQHQQASASSACTRVRSLAGRRSRPTIW